MSLDLTLKINQCKHAVGVVKICILITLIMFPACGTKSIHKIQAWFI